MRVLIGSRNLEYPWIFAVLGLIQNSVKMASRFATVSKDEILAVNETAAPTNTKKQTKFGLSVFTGRYNFFFFCNKIMKNDPRNTVN